MLERHGVYAARREVENMVQIIDDGSGTLPLEEVQYFAVHLMKGVSPAMVLNLLYKVKRLRHDIDHRNAILQSLEIKSKDVAKRQESIMRRLDEMGKTVCNLRN